MLKEPKVRLFGPLRFRILPREGNFWHVLRPTLRPAVQIRLWKISIHGCLKILRQILLFSIFWRLTNGHYPIYQLIFCLKGDYVGSLKSIISQRFLHTGLWSRRRIAVSHVLEDWKVLDSVCFTDQRSYSISRDFKT